MMNLGGNDGTVGLNMKPGRLLELRDFLLESRDKGLLVIPADTEIEVMELPLGDVLVNQKELELIESQGGTNVNGH